MQATEGRHLWECPQSREPHTMRVESLPRNFLIERMVEKFKNQGRFEIIHHTIHGF